MSSNIYIVDDEPQMLRMLQMALANCNLPIHVYSEAKEFLKVSPSEKDIILLDLDMPDIDGIEVIRQLAQRESNASLILISGHDRSILHSAEQLAMAHELTVLANYGKPIVLSDLKNKIEESIQSSRSSIRPSKLKPDEFTKEALENAIQKEEFILHYQPQIALQSNNLVGCEALVRWQHPELGLLPPGAFLPFIDQYNLFNPLSSLVMRLAAEQGNQWQNTGFNTQISVNLSARNITNSSLFDDITRLTIEHNLNPMHLTLEITESQLMDELITSLEILTRLRIKGFSLSIDDFGTGYSSLSQLHRIPFTELKIDRSFVMAMDYDEEAVAIVKTCIMLGHELKMHVVAEGVETEQAMCRLRELGCDIAQGYQIAKPMPGNELPQWDAEYHKAVTTL